ncbi:MAG: sensor histidine kinase, partial [Methanomicrobium sp.]|nr:sensor histidine kinase [Methanomicrobium sp.]
LARNIMIEYSEKLGDISIEVTGDSDLSFDLDTIVPCALITNELITNSYKYAFPDKRAGRISIDISMQKPETGASGQATAQDGDAESEVRYVYTYRDNGVGIRNPTAAVGTEGSGSGADAGAGTVAGGSRKNAGNLLNNPDTLGMKIIRSLVRQLNGVIEIKNSGESSEGTEIIINFRGKL